MRMTIRLAQFRDHAKQRIAEYILHGGFAGAHRQIAIRQLVGNCRGGAVGVERGGRGVALDLATGDANDREFVRY